MKSIRDYSLTVVCLSLFALSFSGRAGAAIRSVPGEYGLIQDALDAAQDGDTVLVADGTYAGVGNRNLTLYGRKVTVKSVNGPDRTVIDCERQTRAFKCDWGETRETVIDGFGISNGLDHGGGAGIGLWTGASPTIRNCIFRDCGDYGGGLFEGGGIRCGIECAPLIENCTYINCQADQGGGIHVLLGSDPTIRNCAFIACVGAAIYAWDDCQVTVSESTFTGNLASQTSHSAAVGLFRNSSGVLTNCFFYDNANDKDGAAVYLYASTVTVTNCTLLDNRSGYFAGGLSLEGSGSHATVVNSIFWNNAPDQIAANDGAVIVTYSDVEGDFRGPGNFSSEPLFALAGDYHLTADSPCKDAGTEVGVSFDIEGDARPAGAGYDVGCDEFAAPLPTVDATLEMPADRFLPHDVCYLRLHLSSSGPSAGPFPVFVLLDVYGAYYFWPSWTGEPGAVDYLPHAIPAGELQLEIIESFTWPEGVGAADNLSFLAAVTDPALMRLLGATARWEFSYGE